ncbi:unnamed protein product [Trifolium pratense]|uniref:Uncharacterized protein n=1 Tax=Trifolium pratense TaxID=57577 RepID=A0ACB0JV07_TRIPR|nr:unnamed protein product [Trifolium pratense]
MYTETFDHSIEDKIEEIYPEAINGSPSIRDSSIEVLNGCESSSSDSERQIDEITRDESGENNSLETHIKRTKSLSSSGRKSSSSSLSDLSSDDFFGIDTLKFTASEPASKSEKNYVSSSDESSAKYEKKLSSDDLFGIDTFKFTASEPASKSEKNYVSSRDESSAKFEKKLSSDDFFGIDTLKFATSDASEPASKSEKNYVSSSDESSAKSETEHSPPVPASTYQVYNVAYSPKGMSPTISPPIQVMDRSGRYDPTRIPSSIFEINNNHNPLEWSLASNDSLFSIHIDQYSFSKDTFKFRESQKSEELTKPVEQNTFNRIPSVTIEKIDIASKSDDIEDLEPLEESFRFKPHLNEEDQHDIKSLHEAARSMSTKSSATTLSQTIRHAFVPLNKSSRRSCNFCNCSWGFCHHKGPTCWPSCKCSCGWLFCSCCNSSLSTPILRETDGNSFVKTDDALRQESYKEGSETAIIQSKPACAFCSNSSCNSCNWFHCFTCCTCKLSCAGFKCCC